MVNRKNTRLAIAKWLREQGIDCGTTIKLGDTFTLNGQTLKLQDAATNNTWGRTNGLMRLEPVA
jgi:hypothetical protein